MKDITYLKLKISDFRAWVHLGCSKEEKHHKQMISIDIELIFDNKLKALVSDNITDTICYYSLITEIEKHLEDKRFNLIEHMSYYIKNTISDYITQSKVNCKNIVINVNKVSPSIPNLYGGVQFEI